MRQNLAVRARLKKWHQPLASALSAHLFSGALCTQLWCAPGAEYPAGAGDRLVHSA